MPERITILLVEDDPAVRAMAARMLDSLGYTVCEAADGRAALELLRDNNDIALLFTDLVMPNKMSGQELLVRARELRPGLKALFTSGFTGQFIAARGGADSSVPLLHKPYRKQKLAEAVLAALEARAP